MFSSNSELYVPVSVRPIPARTAARLVIEHHYLYRRPPISYAYGLIMPGSVIRGVVTFGVPASRHLQKSACRQQPDLVLELNRLWVADELPTNSESWFVARALALCPARIIVSYADPVYGHFGYVYRALNFRYAGWTDMERKTPRFDYIPANTHTHTRDAFRKGFVERRRRVAKVKYWTVTGTPSQRRLLRGMCDWPSYDWKMMPPPGENGHDDDGQE